MIDIIAIGSRLKQLRKERNVTLEIAAEEMGIAISTLSRIERGGRGFSIDNLDIFVEYYKCSSDYILYGHMNTMVEAKLDKLSSYKKDLTYKLFNAILEVTSNE